MRKNLVLFSLIALGCLPVLAELTVNDTTDPEYLRNHDYSEMVIYQTQKSKATISGEPYKRVESGYFNQTYDWPVIKQIRQIVQYIDPGVDDNSFYNDHDIKGGASFFDL